MTGDDRSEHCPVLSESWYYTIERFQCDNRCGEHDNSLFRRILKRKKAEAIMLYSHLTKQFWAEAIRTAS